MARLLVPLENGGVLPVVLFRRCGALCQKHSHKRQARNDESHQVHEDLLLKKTGEIGITFAGRDDAP